MNTEPFFLGFGQMLGYCLITVNIRAVAAHDLPIALLTDGLFQTVSFFLIRRIAKSSDEDSLRNWLGYTIGGLIGTALGLWIS